VAYAGLVPQAEFDRLQAGLRPNDPALTPDLLMLLTFCKMNAGHAYGVRVVKAAHNRRDRRRTDLARQVIVIAQEEEEYHTRILVGASQAFNLKARVAYRPPLALKALIYSLAYAPRPFFPHPVRLRSRGRVCLQLDAQPPGVEREGLRSGRALARQTVRGLTLITGYSNWWDRLIEGESHNLAYPRKSVASSVPGLPIADPHLV
jgi:hypothetical protein